MKRLMFKRYLVAVAVAVTATLAVGSANAGGGGIVGATEMTQLLNNGELLAIGVDQAKTALTVVDQYTTQLRQFETQLASVKALTQLPAGLGADNDGALNNLLNYRGALQQLTGSLGQQQSLMQQRLTEARLSGKDWTSYVNSVAADAANKNQRAIDRLQYEESVLQQVRSDYAFARNAQTQIPATVGQHQALQLLNSQMNRVVTQNAKLIEVMSSTIGRGAERDAREAESAARALSQQDLLRQRQEAIERRQRSFGGFQ